MPSARNPEVIYRLFGDRLRKLREAKGMPQEELATQSGLTRSSIANIERGRQRVLLHQLRQFAEALQVEVATLLRTDDVCDQLQRQTNSEKSAYLERLRERIVHPGEEPKADEDDSGPSS